MKLASTIFLISLFFNSLFGQVNTDSLWQIWKGNNYPLIERLQAFENICTKQYLYTKPDSAFAQAKIAYEFAENKNLKDQMASNLHIMGVVSSLQFNYPQAIEYLNESLKISRELGDEAATTKYLNSLGDVYAKKGDYALAVENYTQSLQITEQHDEHKKDSFVWPIALFFLGLVSGTLIAFLLLKKQKKGFQAHINELKGEIEQLKIELNKPKKSISQKQKRTLNKAKIEEAINNKIGASSWLILTIISDNPSISNKEIAEKVSLSVEGVSSSLRRMYTAFDIKSPGNKKITLLMKAFNLSEK